MKTLIKILIGISLLFLFINTVNAIDIEYDDEIYDLDEIKENNGNIKISGGKSITIPENIINDIENENTNGIDTGSSKEYVGEFKTQHSTKICVGTKNKVVKKGKFVLTMSKRDFKSFKINTLKNHDLGQSCPKGLLKFASYESYYDEYGDYNKELTFKNTKFKVKILKKVKTKEVYQIIYDESRDYRHANGYKYLLTIKKYKSLKDYKKVPIYVKITIDNIKYDDFTSHYNYLNLVYFKNGKEKILI